MVVLIKAPKDGGKRTVQLVKNAPKSTTSLTIEDFIEALKNLTFKLEVRIADVVPTTSAQSAPQSPEPPLSPEPTPSPEPTRVAPPTPSQPPMPQPPAQVQQPQPPTPRPSPVQVKQQQQPTPPPTPRPFVQVQQPVAAAKSPAIPVQPALVQPAEQKVVVSSAAKKAPVERIAHGLLEVGSTMETCCIAVDDRTKPALGYISHDHSKLMKIAEIVNEIESDIDRLQPMDLIEVGDIVFAKSMEDNMWYRSSVEGVNGNEVKIFFFDWGLRETLGQDRVRKMNHPELGLSTYPACAVLIKFLNKSQTIIDEVLKCESVFIMKVESYDEELGAYLVTILDD